MRKTIIELIIEASAGTQRVPVSISCLSSIKGLHPIRGFRRLQRITKSNLSLENKDFGPLVVMLTRTNIKRGLRRGTWCNSSSEVCISALLEICAFSETGRLEEDALLF